MRSADDILADALSPCAAAARRQASCVTGIDCVPRSQVAMPRPAVGVRCAAQFVTRIVRGNAKGIAAARLESAPERWFERAFAARNVGS
jgi:hypothetical protein